MREINEIIIHCSASDWGHDIGVKEIRVWHQARGWSDIGYHYVIRLDGSIEQGRPRTRAGAHVKGRNANSIGICLVGGKDGTDAYRPAQWRALEMVVESMKYRWPDAAVYGHNDFTDQKTCPNFDAAEWWLSIQ